MSKEGSINLNTVRAHYSIKDIRLVSLDDVGSANEKRFLGELFLSIGLTLFGNYISTDTPNKMIVPFMCVFGALALIFFAWSGIKYYRLSNATTSPIDIPIAASPEK